MQRRTITIALPLLFTASLGRAQTATPIEGTHYTVLKDAVPPAVPGKIEVLEFFSYGCPACNAFDPALERWARALPADVSFRRVPVPFLYNADNFQRTFYALEMTKSLDPCHSKVFEAVHLEKRRLSKPEEIAEVVARAGGDSGKFVAAFGSFSMAAHLARAKAATSSCKIEQIPTLAIAGRFTTSPAQAGGTAQALATASYLLTKSRTS